MIEIWTVLTPILIADVINPVLFAFMVYAVSTERPIINSSALLIGHTLAYFSAGVILSLGLERVSYRLANPQQIDFVIGLVVGVLLIWAALGASQQSAERKTTASKQLTPFKALGLGAIVNFVGIPFALPYFAAIDQILKANLTVSESLILLVGYNVLYALPFVIVPLLVAFMGERSQGLLQRINKLLERISRFLMPVILLLLGAALVADAIRYFMTGEGLF